MIAPRAADHMIEQLDGALIFTTSAEAAINARMPTRPPMARPSEKTIQQAIVDLACGSKVSPGLGFYRYSTSQYRASHVSEGLPDLILFQVKAGIALWWETKSYDGKLWKRGTVALQPLSPMQERFRLHCRSTGELHGWGALPEFYLMLLLLGFAQVSEGGSLILNPRGDARHVIRS